MKFRLKLLLIGYAICVNMSCFAGEIKAGGVSIKLDDSWKITKMALTYLHIHPLLFDHIPIRVNDKSAFGKRTELYKAESDASEFYLAVYNIPEGLDSASLLNRFLEASITSADAMESFITMLNFNKDFYEDYSVKQKSFSKGTLAGCWQLTTLFKSTRSAFTSLVTVRGDKIIYLFMPIFFESTTLEPNYKHWDELLDKLKFETVKHNGSDKGIIS